MKKFFLILLLLVLLIGGWLGYREFRRSSLLSSGDQLLLVKDDKSAYAFSEDILFDNIDRSWDVIGKVSSLSAERVAKEIEGINQYQEFTASSIVKDYDVQVPNAEEVAPWQEVLATLAPAQREQCESIQSLDYAQFCLVSHYINQLITSTASAESCDRIFVESYRNDCREALSNPQNVDYPDVNGNQIIDFFEQYNRTEEESASFSEQPGVIN